MRLLTVADVADQLQLSRAQVYEIKGTINYAKLGGAVRFRQADVDRYVDENLVGPHPQQTRERLQCIRL